MPHQPTYPSPYMETVDMLASGGIPYKCLINPKDTVLDAVIRIYNNDNEDGIPLKVVRLPDDLFPFRGGWDDSSWLECNIDNIGFDGSEVLSNGKDYKWSIFLESDAYELYSRTVNGSTDEYRIRVSSASSFIGYIDRGFPLFVVYNEHYYYIQNIEKSSTSSSSNYYYIYYQPVDDGGGLIPDGASVSIALCTKGILSPEYFFKARSTPDITFDVPATLNKMNYTFEAEYSQEQNVGISCYEFNLYSDGELVDSSGQIYSQLITYSYDNFINEKDYRIELIIITDDGVEIRKERSFDVSYETISSGVLVETYADTTTNSVVIDWSNNQFIPVKIEDVSKIDYRVFGSPSHSVVAKGRILSFTNSQITVSKHEDLMEGMYLSINSETYTIAKVTESEDYTIIETTPHPSSLSVGDSYEVWSYYNGIHLSDNNSIEYNKVASTNLIFPEDSTQVIHWHKCQGFDSIIFEKTNSYDKSKIVTALWDGEKFSYSIDGQPYESYCPYVGTDSAIAGRGTQSVLRTVQNYNASSSSIVFENSPIIESGKIVQIGNEHRTILSVEVGDITTTAVLNTSFKGDISQGDRCVIYDENYNYILNDNDEILDADILIDNDITENYWWLIVVLPNEIRFMKSLAFTESEV